MPYADPKKRRKYLRNYQRKWVLGRRKAWLAKQGPCALCGSEDRLEIDHIEPSEKSVSIGTIWSWAADRREVELAKCQVLCHRCHENKTTLDRRFRSNYFKHGAERMYRKEKCRCVLCHQWKSKENAKRKVMGWQ